MVPRQRAATAETRRRIDGYELVALVCAGVKFRNEKLVEANEEKDAA